MPRFAPSLLGLGLALVALTAVTGCKKPAGTPFPYADGCDDSRRDKRITIEGYLAAYSSTTCKAGGCEFLYQEKPKGEQGASLYQVTIPVGGGDSEMSALPKNFSESDVKVHTKSGVIGLNQKIRVTGTISRTFVAKNYDPATKKSVDKLHCELTEPTIEGI